MTKITDLNRDGTAERHARCIDQATNSNLNVPDWDHKCENCGETPVVPSTGLCGPCTFGEADTAGGNW